MDCTYRGEERLKILYETPDPRNPKVQVLYQDHANEYECFGLSCSVPTKGDIIQPNGGPRFVITAAAPYGSGFRGMCKLKSV